MESRTRYILVTGANGGIGLAICARLIDDFLNTQPDTDHLTLIFTTRSPQKSSETVTALQRHLSQHASSSRGLRVQLQPENLELTSLLSVRSLATKLLSSDIPYLDAIILNAGIGKWSGLDWPKAIWDCLVNLRQSTTWPQFKNGMAGLIAQPQFPRLKDGSKIEEPLLGEIFCANVLGHYMLAHWLMPLFWACPSGSPAKVIWSGSIEATPEHYDPKDHQTLQSVFPYEGSKRMTDLMVLTSENQCATARQVNDFLQPSSSLETKIQRPVNVRPLIRDIHPGVCVTPILPLHWIMLQAWIVTVYVARLLGAVWSVADPYLAAVSFTFVAFASPEKLAALEDAEGGKGMGKFGSARNRMGTVTIRRSDVGGWGINGSGEPFADSWWGGANGRKTGSQDATIKDVQQFIGLGASVWREMERSRHEWEERIDRYISLQK